LEVQGEASIDSSTYSKGNGGELTINAENLKVINGGSIDNIVGKKATGKGGSLAIDADNIFLSGTNTAITTKVEEEGVGAAGSLAITSDKLEVKNGAQISSSSFGQGNGGDLFVNSNEILLTNDEAVLNNFGPFKDLAPEILATGIKADLKSGSTGNSGNLTVKADSLIVQNGASININNSGIGSSGNLVVDADKIILAGNGIGDITGITNDALSTGILGEMTVTADNLQIQNSAKIRSITFDAAMGGNLNVNGGTITISGNNRRVFTGITTQAEFFSTGDAGDLTVTAGKIVLQDSAFISTLTTSSGKAGNLLVNVDNLIGNAGALITTQTSGTGNAGNLTVNAKHIKLNDGSKIDATTFGSGQGGNLTVNANTILLANDTGSERVSAIVSISRGIEDNAGNSGDLTINANHLEMRDGALITARTDGPGKGGNLMANVNDLLLNNARLSSISQFKGTDISQNSDVGKSGDIRIKLGNILRLENNSGIDVSTNKANAGEITIRGGKILHVSDSNITTSVADGEGSGGNIFISTPIVVLDSSDIIARAAKGKGGNISISGFLFQSPSSIVDASSGLGIDGNIDLKPDTNISGSLAALPDTFLHASQQMSERCTARSGNDLSSFVIKGRGGAPLSPGNLAPSNFLDYLETKENSALESMTNPSSYSNLGNSVQFVSSNIDCGP
jgi:large exoprotein involved in heme utilization and adhesion